jgi:hypothetical protein
VEGVKTMVFKVEFDKYPLMTRYYEKECGYTLEEVEMLSLKRMITGMTARIYLANEFIKEITK